MQDGFDEVMREHGAALRRVAACYAPRGADREDMEQEIALALWRAWPTFRGECAPRTFALRVAHNRCVDLLRRRALPTTSAEAEPPSLAPSPERAVATQRRLEALERAILSLPLGQRQPLVLALEGCTHAEIAQITGLSESNVAVRIHRARLALKRSMEDDT